MSVLLQKGERERERKTHREFFPSTACLSTTLLVLISVPSAWKEAAAVGGGNIQIPNQPGQEESSESMIESLKRQTPAVDSRADKSGAEINRRPMRFLQCRPEQVGASVKTILTTDGTDVDALLVG